jgi:hypothetical protein
LYSYLKLALVGVLGEPFTAAAKLPGLPPLPAFRGDAAADKLPPVSEIDLPDNERLKLLPTAPPEAAAAPDPEPLALPSSSAAILSYFSISLAPGLREPAAAAAAARLTVALLLPNEACGLIALLAACGLVSRLLLRGESDGERWPAAPMLSLPAAAAPPAFFSSRPCTQLS